MDKHKLILPISIFLGCVILGSFLYVSQISKQKFIERQQQAKIAEEKNEQEKSTANINTYYNFQYLSLGELVPVYNEHDIRVGYLTVAINNNECGSECASELLFINSKDNQLVVESVDNLVNSGMGNNLTTDSKYVYTSSYIWGENEGHFGCHKFKIQKVKFINNKLEVLDEQITRNKYAFDSGDAQGKCILFPGLDNVLISEQLFK